MTYREARAAAQRMLENAGIEEAENDSLLLMEYICGTDFGAWLLVQDKEISPDLGDRYFAMIKKRESHVPLQHITGTQSFMGLDFQVNDSALIPRLDTEILGEEAVRIIRDMQMPPTVLDLCTGSGCLAVALKVLCPDCDVWASDISEAALALACENARANHADISFVFSDLFENINRKFDLIVSNPPYIPAPVVDTLACEVKDHEPRLALDGGEDGLDFYKKILAQCIDQLTPGGCILLEIGCDQAGAVTALMRENGFFDIRVIRDLAGLDRVIRGRRK